jgi:DNA polymerase III epsilon subunit-like protein
LEVEIFALKAGRRLVMNSNLLRFNKDKKFLVFDYETCSLNLSSPDNKPWQLAFLVCSHKEVEERHDFYLKWDDLKISDGAKQVTGFKESVYKKRAVDPLEVLDLFESYFYNEEYYIVGHNIIGFDIYIHNIHRLLCKKSSDFSYLNRLIDTNCLAKANALNIEYDSSDLTLWQFKLQKIKQRGLKTNLKSLCQKYKIDFDEAKLHDALYDIEQNFKVFKSMIWESNI